MRFKRRELEEKRQSNHPEPRMGIQSTAGRQRKSRLLALHPLHRPPDPGDSKKTARRSISATTWPVQPITVLDRSSAPIIPTVHLPGQATSGQ